MFSTPILLVIFNRPETTRRVFESIRQQKPKYLFVAADGPRPERVDDIEKCKAARNIIKPDWDCELYTLFRDNNLGCGKGPSQAITWFFSQVEEGIILEDDCVPNPDFFQYCTQLLDHFRDNERISFIGGTNFQRGFKRGIGSYYFSAGNQGTWGWATWKRAWDKFDYYISNIDKGIFSKIIKNFFINPRQREYWMEIFTEVKKNRYNESCWDYQFYFSNWVEGKLAVLPNQNLVRNIGFDTDATHTIGENNPLMNVPLGSIFPIEHNHYIVQDKNADFYVHKNYIQPYAYGWQGLLGLPFRLNKRIKKLFGIQGSWVKKYCRNKYK